MKFGMLALDYDGTISREGVLDPENTAVWGDLASLVRSLR